MDAQGPQHVYLSPHLDDVVLSCGGTIYRQVRAGERVLVVTFFAGSPEDDSLTAFARELKARWGGAEDPVAVRRREDLAALAVLGAEGLHLPFLDCVYRQDPRTGEALYPQEESIFGEVHPAEAGWHRELLAALEARLGSLDGAKMYAPLTVGHHVDHILVQRLAFALLRRGAQVLFYEDYPYAGDTQAVEAVLRTWPELCWSSETLFFSEEALRAKQEAIARHASQISTFWANLEDMRRAVRAQALRVGGAGYAERFWWIRSGCLPAEESC
jgi:LmbE family N-acetylglucosaminyl deacetylase